MRPEDNAVMAHLARYNLKNHDLDIPGTVYFDPVLDNLYDFYTATDKRGYYVLVDRDDNVVGGIGFAEFELFENCAELQKLYLDDSAKGYGMGYKLIDFVESEMRNAGYSSSYLETHRNLKAAMHIYEKSGYRLIDRPADVAHGAMTHFYFKEL